MNFTTTPQFLPPHTLNGSNCDAVLEITRKLRDMGNKQVYGLIDWDLKNTPEEQVIILGSGNRYAIENYIFEPHFVGLYLIHKKFTTPAELGMADCNSYLDVINKVTTECDSLQILIDSVQNKILWGSQEVSLVESELIDGTITTIRQEVLEMKGHDLEAKVKDTWPQLNSVRSNNGGDSALKKDIINTVINDFPGLCSKDLSTTFGEFK